MTRIATLAFPIWSALVAMAMSGCVREEIGPTNFHTTAYVEHDASSADEQQTPPTKLTPPSGPDDSSSSSDQPHH